MLCFHLKVKLKSASSSSKTTTTTTTTRVRQKKVFSLPGQRCDPPEEVWLWNFHFLLSFWIMSFVLTVSFIFIFIALFFSQREPLRIFYESLSKQIPNSEMAEFWWAFLHQLHDHKSFSTKYVAASTFFISWMGVRPGVGPSAYCHSLLNCLLCFIGSLTILIKCSNSSVCLKEVILGL